MSLLSPLTTFKTGDYTVTRNTAGARGADGAWIEGSVTTFASTPMQITPVVEALVKTLPEGQSVEDTRTVRCAFDLKNRDVVAFESETWRVFRTRRWTVRGVSYSWGMIARERLGV